MASSQTIQPATADTILQEASPDTNYDTLTPFPFSVSAGIEKRILVKFDFSGLVPTGATITTAILSFFVPLAKSSIDVTAARLLRTDWVSSEATWNHYKGTSDWSTAGCKNNGADYTSTNAVTVTGAIGADSWLDFNVTAQVQTALDSVSGVAHFAVYGNGAPGTMSAYSSDYSTAELRPKLYIEYTGLGSESSSVSSSPSSSPSVSPSTSPSKSPSSSPSSSISFSGSSSSSVSSSPSASPSDVSLNTRYTLIT